MVWRGGIFEAMNSRLCALALTAYSSDSRCSARRMVVWYLPYPTPFPLGFISCPGPSTCFRRGCDSCQNCKVTQLACNGLKQPAIMRERPYDAIHPKVGVRFQSPCLLLEESFPGIPDQRLESHRCGGTSHASKALWRQGGK